jgi:hypothetical protein
MRLHGGFNDWLCGFIVLTSLASVRAAEFHATPNGSSTGNGSLAQPWDLATALLAAEVVKPGDTVWIHEGTYRGGFESRLNGRPDAPVIVRGVRGARVTIDLTPRDPQDSGLLLLRGADASYRDFEVTCNHPQRETKIAGSWPADIRRGNVDVRGDRISAVNLVVHDCGSGFGFWAEGEGGEISGCLIYNNGWRGPDRGHGHGIYAQNARGTKRIVDNVVFHQFAYGIHVYGSEKASLKGFEIEGNIVFENGCLTRPGDHAPGIMVGGGSAVERLAVRDNTVIGGGIRLGYPWGTISEDVICTGNYTESLVLRDFRKAIVNRNTVVASSTVVSLEGAGQLLLAGLLWNDNDYYVTDGRWGETSVVEQSKSRGLSFTEWRTTTGLDAQSTFTKGPPTKLRVIVRPNTHEPGRAHVAVLNPAKLPEVAVDLSQVLKMGQRFRVVSVKDFYGPTILTGVYDGRPVPFPLKPITTPTPVGMPNAQFPVTEPAFAAFVVVPVD